MRLGQIIGSKRRFGSLGLAIAACAGGLSSATHAQWTVVSLHPAWATESVAAGIEAGRQTGYADNLSVALLWQGSGASAVTLNPGAGSGAISRAIAGGREAGSFTTENNVASHGIIWNGSAQSWVDLHPSDPAIIHSNVLGMDSATQVGSYFIDTGATFSAGRACMWSGTPASFVDLNPAGFMTSEARGAFGNQQVGGTFDSGLGSACMWTGSAASFVDLAPPDSIFSIAQCADGAHQYGSAGVLSPVPGIFPTRWSGSGESWENMGTPDGLYGEINATSNGYQVGDTFDMNSENFRAIIWTDRLSFEDLHQYLPAAYTQSQAYGVWRDVASGATYVVGYGQNGTTGHTEAMMWVQSPGTNLIVSPAAPADCTVAAGAAVSYSVRVLNAGTAASGPVTLTVDLPAAGVATYQSAVPPPATVTATQLTFNLSPLGASGAFTDVSITLNAVGAGANAAITATAATAGEVDPTNNTATASTRIQPAPPAAAIATGLLSTVTTQANSLIPGGAGHYTGFTRPIASPSGNWWIVSAQSDLPSSQQRLYVRAQAGNSPSIIAQQGVTPTGHGTLTIFDGGAEVNDSGLVAIAGSDNGTSASARFIATTDGTGLVDVARGGQPIPSMPGVNYGTSVGISANIFTNGQTSFYTTSTPSGNSAYLSNNGSTIIARQNVTTPIGAPAPIDTFVSNASGTGTLQFDAAGTHFIYQADVNTGSSADDQVIVADGTMVMRESVTILPGLASAVDGNNKVFFMGPEGTWFVRGANLDATEQWAVRGAGTSIAHVYKGGDPIFAGANETWKAHALNSVASTTFFASIAGAGGHTVVGGYTSAADLYTDSVLVYDDATVIARENDPVDLDGNGIFDDGVYIRSFDTDSVAFVPGGVLVTVTLRDAEAALCHTNNVSRGQALVRVPLPVPCYANCDGSTTPPVLNINDFICFQSRFASGDPYANCDGSTQPPVLNVNDFICFQGRFVAGCQ